MNNKIAYIIIAVCVLLIPFFTFQMINHSNNISSQLFSGFMIICLIIAGSLIISYWRDVKKGKK